MKMVQVYIKIFGHSKLKYEHFSEVKVNMNDHQYTRLHVLQVVYKSFDHMMGLETSLLASQLHQNEAVEQEQFFRSVIIN